VQNNIIIHKSIFYKIYYKRIQNNKLQEDENLIQTNKKYMYLLIHFSQTCKTNKSQRKTFLWLKVGSTIW
jgi:hypothetical protein